MLVGSATGPKALVFVCRVFVVWADRRLLCLPRRISDKGVLRRKSDEGDDIPGTLCDEGRAFASVLPSSCLSKRKKVSHLPTKPLVCVRTDTSGKSASRNSGNRIKSWS